MLDWNRKEPRTRVCLDAGSDLTRANIIKIGNILVKDSFEVALTNTPRRRLAGIDPNIHVNESADKHAHAYNPGDGRLN